MRKNTVFKHFLPIKLHKEPINRRILRLFAAKFYKSDRLLEEPNRYDPANFIIVLSNFFPANYRKADLFEAVAASERLGISGMTPSGIDWGAPAIDFVSDVVFISQNGTDITFRTVDNAISKRMKVDSRTGLTSGQKVRLYYTAYRIQDWRIVAIERL